MHESFLSYLWQLQYFDKRDLKTTDHEKIEIYHPGFINTNAGPDFSNSRIKIGSMDWVGSVEIHTVSSEWFAHHHDTDRAYDNVILHLVWQHDKEIVRTDNTILPTLELKGRVDESLIKTYRQLVSSSFSIPCQRSIMNVEGLTRLSMIEKAMLERLERKAIEITAIYSQNGNSWEETFYQLLARNFGFKINSEPFFQLAKLLPLKIIQKQADKKEQVEALLFGQAGFLEPTKGDEYFLKLRREHILLTQKYSLLQNKMSKAQWRFLRLRPANFPSLRLAQFASILHSRQNIFSAILGLEDIKSIANLFSVTVSDYWLHHYQFSKQSKSDVHELGKSSIENIIINTIVPVWVAYGRMTHEQRWIDLSVHILQQLPAEENNITRAWKGVGMDANNSFDSQGLIELYNNFCQQKNCLNCTIGASLMRPAKMTYLIAFINLLVLGCVAGSIYNRQPDNMKPLYRTALVVKLLAGFAVGWLYFYYYGEGDTITYWQDGKIVSDLIMDNPSGALRFFWNENADPELLPGLINLQQRSLFFAKISGILSLLTSGNYWLMSILISSVSFLGAWYIFRRVTDFFPSSDQAAALSFLFFPSVVFWSSGLIKESLGLASIFFLTAIFLNLCQYKKVKWGDGVLIILSLWIGWNLKYYWIGVFVPVILTTAIIIRLKHSFVFFQRFDGASWVVLFVIIFLTGTSIHPNFYPNRFLEVIVENNREFMLLTYPDNAVHYNDLSATFGSVLMNSPQALVAGFFRPFIWEGHHIISVAAGVENTVLLILFITSIISIKRFFSSPDRLMALAAIAYCVVLGIFLALSTPNFGTLSRYKIGFLPFLVFLTVYKNPFVNKMTGLAGR